MSCLGLLGRFTYFLIGLVSVHESPPCRTGPSGISVRLAKPKSWYDCVALGCECTRIPCGSLKDWAEVREFSGTTSTTFFPMSETGLVELSSGIGAWVSFALSSWIARRIGSSDKFTSTLACSWVGWVAGVLLGVT